MIEVRAVGEADDEAVADLLVRTFSDLYARTGLEMSETRRAYLRDQVGRRGRVLTLAAMEADEMVGTVAVTPPSSMCEAWVEGAWDLRLLAVEPRAQGRGIARRLVAEAERRAVEGGARTLCLHARLGMAAQARFYPSCGYLRDPAGDQDGPPAQIGFRKAL